MQTSLHYNSNKQPRKQWKIKFVRVVEDQYNRMKAQPSVMFRLTVDRKHDYIPLRIRTAKPPKPQQCSCCPHWPHTLGLCSVEWFASPPAPPQSPSIRGSEWLFKSRSPGESFFVCLFEAATGGTIGNRPFFFFCFTGRLSYPKKKKKNLNFRPFSSILKKSLFFVFSTFSPACVLFQNWIFTQPASKFNYLCLQWRP